MENLGTQIVGVSCFHLFQWKTSKDKRTHWDATWYKLFPHTGRCLGGCRLRALSEPSRCQGLVRVDDGGEQLLAVKVGC